MTDDGLTPTQRAFLAASQLRESFEDMSAQEINRLPMADYAQIRERAGLPAADPFAESYAPTPPGGSPATVHPGQDPQPGTDFASLSMAEYGRVRDQLGIGRSPSARGLFN